MFSRVFSGLLLIGFLNIAANRPAHAQFAVIDAASLGQLIQEYQTLQQQLATAQSQLSQAQAQYTAMTGTRGMQNLLSGTPRNYLPSSWAQLSAAMSGPSAAFPALGSEVATLISVNAVLTPAQLAALSPSEQADLVAARQSAALLAAISHTALANSSSRFSSLQQLISAIAGASDQKAALDLTARIAGEQGMLQNESTKLQVLSQVAQAQEWTRAQRVRERAIVDQGSLRTLPPMGL
jgi:type IV secretion system protein VirB5